MSLRERGLHTKRRSWSVRNMSASYVPLTHKQHLLSIDLVLVMRAWSELIDAFGKLVAVWRDGDGGRGLLHLHLLHRNRAGLLRRRRS